MKASRKSKKLRRQSQSRSMARQDNQTLLEALEQRLLLSFDYTLAPYGVQEVHAGHDMYQMLRITANNSDYHNVDLSVSGASPGVFSQCTMPTKSGAAP